MKIEIEHMKFDVGRLYMNTMPTISYGSILQMNVVKMTMNFVMKINTNITPLIEGDAVDNLCTQKI